MLNSTFVLNKEYTFQEAVLLLAHALSSIGAESQETVFSMADILHLLRSVNEYVPGEFDIRQTHPHYYQILYRTEEEVIESFKEKWEGFNQ